MSRWTPCKRADFIRKLRQLGFDGLRVEGMEVPDLHTYSTYIEVPA